MNWFQKVAQSLLSASFELETDKIGTVFVEIQCSYEDYDRWWKYKTGAQGWNDSQVRDSDAMNRAIEMEPDCRLRINHRFSESMPRVDRPVRTPEEKQDAFNIVGDEMLNLQNDEFYQTMKIKDVGETIRNWLFMPIGGTQRAELSPDLKFDLSIKIPGATEELFQQYTNAGT